MKTKFRTRLILSVLMLGMTAITLTTSTFAWFATNRYAWFDEIELEIGNTDSLMISVDGKTYGSSISPEQFKRAVVANKKKISYNDQSLADLNYVNNEFKRVSLDPVTTNDLINFKGVDKEHVKDYLDDSGKPTGKKYYELHNVEEKNNYAFLQFDVWFMVDASKSATKTFNLKLVNDDYIEKEKNAGNTIKASYIEGDESIVKIYNTLNTIDKTYNTGDEIKVNCKDAIRLGLKRLEQAGKEDNKDFIFEPHEGLGSYALKDYLNTTDSNYYKYDPNKNAMFTYFNKLNEAVLEPLEKNFDYVNGTYKNNLKDNVSLGKIVPNENKISYEPLKFTLSIWLEGYDADYIIGMKNNSVKIYLNFYVEEEKGSE